MKKPLFFFFLGASVLLCIAAFEATVINVSTLNVSGNTSLVNLTGVGYDQFLLVRDTDGVVYTAADFPVHGNINVIGGGTITGLGSLAVGAFSVGTFTVTNFLAPDVLAPTNGAANGWYATYNNGTNKYVAPPAVGGTVTFNSAQFDSGGSATNIKSGAWFTNIFVAGHNNGGSPTNWTYTDPLGWHNTNNAGVNQGVDIAQGNVTAQSQVAALSMLVSNLMATNSIIIGKLAALRSTNALEIWDQTNTVNPVFDVANTNTAGSGINRVRVGGTKLIQGFGGAAGTTSEFDVSPSGALNTAAGITAGTFLTLGGPQSLSWASRSYMESTFNGAIRALRADGARLSSIESGITNETQTANYTINILESGIDFNDSGAGGAHTNTLPASIPGTHAYFTCLAAQTMDIKAATAQDTIRYGATVSAGGGDIFTSAIGSTLHIKCPVTNVWIIDQLVGTWTGPQ
jgi:hypothetical protein